MYDVFNEYEEMCDLVEDDGAALDFGLMRGPDPRPLKR